MSVCLSACRVWVNASSRSCAVTPLHYAAALGHASVVALLLQYGACLNARYTRWTPIWSGLDLHASLEPLVSGMHSTALQLAACGGHRRAVVELLRHYVSSLRPSL